MSCPDGSSSGPCRELKDITRVSGPFVVEATIAPAQTLQYVIPVSANGRRRPVDAYRANDAGLAAVQDASTAREPDLVLEGIRRLADANLHAEAIQPDNKQRLRLSSGRRTAHLVGCRLQRRE